VYGTPFSVSISARTALSILWRSFFIQAAWNFKGMQNLGFTHAIIPGIREVSPGSLEESIARHLAFFNTQPYMAPTIIGVYLHLHEQGRQDMIPKFAPSLPGSLAALGDTFFWATLKPILALLCLLCIFMDRMSGLFLALILFNAAHLWIMVWGFHLGYRQGPQGAMSLGRVLSVDTSRRLGLAIPLLSGAALGLGARWSGHDFGLAAGTAVFLLSVVLIKLRVNVFWLVYGVFALSVVWTMLR